MDDRPIAPGVRLFASTPRHLQAVPAERTVAAMENVERRFALGARTAHA